MPQTPNVDKELLAWALSYPLYGLNAEFKGTRWLSGAVSPRVTVELSHGDYWSRERYVETGFISGDADGDSAQPYAASQTLGMRLLLAASSERLCACETGEERTRTVMELDAMVPDLLWRWRQISVEGQPVTFQAAEVGEEDWIAYAHEAGSTIWVQAHHWPNADQINLARVTDLTPYLTRPDPE